MHLVHLCTHNTLRSWHKVQGPHFHWCYFVPRGSDIASLQFQFPHFWRLHGEKNRLPYDVHFPWAFRELCQWRSVLFRCNHNRGRENGCNHCIHMNINVQLISAAAGHIVCACVCARVCVCVCVCEKAILILILCVTLWIYEGESYVRE